MKLNKILQGLDVLSVQGNPDVEVTSLTNDSRRSAPAACSSP